MCGRFAQAQSREEYLAHLVEAAERDFARVFHGLDETLGGQVAPGAAQPLDQQPRVHESVELRCRRLGAG